MSTPEVVAAAAAAAATAEDPFTQPPWIKVAGLNNLRDVGGYAIASRPGYATKKGLLYRSAAPQHLTSEAARTLTENLHITTVFDLRSKPELKTFEDEQPVMNIDGIERIFVPVYEDQDWSPEALASRWTAYTTGDLATAYFAILQAGAAKCFPTILRHLIAHPDEGSLIHCTAGKDRTGVLAAVILTLAGVEEEDICKEFALTTLAMKHFRERIESTLKSHEIFKTMQGLPKEGVDNLLSSKEETMRDFLKLLKERGGVEKYLKEECKLSDEEVVKLKKTLVVKE